MKQRDCEAFLDAWLSTEGVGGVRRRGEGSPHVDLIAKEGVRRLLVGKVCELYTEFRDFLELFTRTRSFYILELLL